MGNKYDSAKHKRKSACKNTSLRVTNTSLRDISISLRVTNTSLRYIGITLRVGQHRTIGDPLLLDVCKL